MVILKDDVYLDLNLLSLYMSLNLYYFYGTKSDSGIILWKKYQDNMLGSTL